MTNQDRDRLRKKQDQLLDLAFDLRVDMQLQIDSRYAGSPRMCELVDCIMPEWEASVDYAIRYLQA